VELEANAAAGASAWGVGSASKFWRQYFDASLFWHWHSRQTFDARQ